MFTQLTKTFKTSDLYTEHLVHFEHDNSKSIKSVTTSCGCTNHTINDQAITLNISTHRVDNILPKHSTKDNYDKTVTAKVTYADDTQDTLTVKLNIYRHEKLDKNKQEVSPGTEFLGT